MTIIEQSYRRATPALVVLALALFVVGTNAFVIAGLLLQIADTLRTSAGAVSVSITTYSLVVAIAAPAISILVPRVPRAALMAAGLAVFSIGTGVAASAPDLGWFLAGRTFSGIGTAMYVGIAIAPPIGALALGAGRAEAVPFAGATVTVVALAAFLLSFVRRVARRSVPTA